MRFQDYYEAALRRGWFDPCFYFDVLQSHGISLADADLSLFEHYATVGWRRGFSPSDRFSVPRYLARYEDIADRQVDPLYHHLMRGRREERVASALHETPEIVQFVGLAECRAGGLADQAALARAYGMSGLCIHYDPDLGRDCLDGIGPETPFCLFLDYRNWTHGDVGDAALKAQYRLIHEVLEILGDPRHIRVRGRPLLVVCRADLLAEPRLTLDLWREAARRAGLGGLFIAGLSFHAGSQDDCGFDALIDAPAASASASAANGKQEDVSGVPVFPGFMPDRDLSLWHGSGANAPEAFREWLGSAAGQTRALAQRGLPQLVFLDARNGWAEGTQGFLETAAQAPEPLRRFAQTITASRRLPVVFLCEAADTAGPAGRLIASLARSHGFECFLVVDGDPGALDIPRRTSALSLRELDGLGWSRVQTLQHLAGQLGARGDLVVVSTSLATADLLALFSAHGHGIAGILHDLPAPLDQAAPALDELARSAHRIIVATEAMRQQIRAACAMPGGDIQVLPPPGEADPAQDWSHHADDVRRCLLGLGNEGRRVRLTGSTLGRQEIAEDLCVVIPSYNHRQFVVAALDSILAQSLRPREIRIIDDGSEDGSAELVRSLASDELGIIVQTRQNMGAHATINQGISETACPIVAVMNSDDRWHPLRVEELIGDLRRSGGADVVFSRVRFIDAEGGSEARRSWYERGIADHENGTPLWLALMFCNFFFTTSNLMTKREVFLEVDGFGPMRYCHDLDYVLKALFAGHKVKFVEQSLCEYRVHGRNTIDQDVNQVLFEEAWIMVKFLRWKFRRISEAERLAVAQRVCDKGLAARVLGILRAAAREAMPLDDGLVHDAARFRDVIEDRHDGTHDTVEARELVHQMAQLMLAQGVALTPLVRG